MDDAREIEELLRYFCRHMLRQAELELERFSRSLEDWVNELLSRRLPRDWRKQLDAFLDWWDAEGFEVAPEHRLLLASWIEGWARARRRMPLPEPVAHVSGDDRPSTGLDADDSVREFIESQIFEMAMSPEALRQLAQVDYLQPRQPPPPPKVERVEERKGLGAWYDEAVASGQYDPYFFTRVAVGLARMFFIDSEPTRVITYDDGKTEIVMGGGPASGAMGAQAAALTGLAGAVATGKVLVEVGETIADTAFQEATGLPVGPSSLKGRRPKQSQLEARPKTHRRGVREAERKPTRRQEDVPDEEPDLETAPDERHNRPLEFWTKKTEFEGHTVYQRDDLIDPTRADSRGRTSLQLMRKGKAPVGPDGESINLHHLLQEPSQPLAEVSATFHQRYRRTLHIDPPTAPSRIDRNKFRAFRERYWMWRAKDFGGKT